MVTFLKGRRRTDDSVVAVDSSGRNIASALEALVARAEAAAGQLRSLAPIMERSAELDALRERCVAVEEQVVAYERLGAQLAAAEQQAARVVQARKDFDWLQQEMVPLNERVQAALNFKAEIDQFLGNQSPLTALRGDTEGLRAQLAELSEYVGRMRGQADDALRAHRHATSRLEAFDQEHQAAAGRLEDVARRVQTVERAMEPVGQAMTAVPDLQHRLAVLKALADQVAQKAGMLEQQREAVDRASNQISQLTRLDRELDAWLRRQEEQIRRFGGIEAKISEVQAVQAKVLSRGEELQTMAQNTEEAQQAARQALNDLREQMRKSSEGFELENRGLHAVSERVADLRNAVKECEARFAVLDAASQGTAAVQGQVRSLVEEAEVLNGQLDRLKTEADRFASLRQEVDRCDARAADLGDRMERLDQMKPDVDQAVQHLASLKGTREIMADGLERMRAANEEMTRLRETHAEVQSWLTSADAWTRKVEGQVKELSELEPDVELIRSQVEQVKAAMGDIDSRRQSVDEMRRQLAEVGSATEDLGRQTQGLKARMEAVESRFGQLTKRADDAQSVSETMESVAETVSEAERRIEAVAGSVAALENRTQQIDEVEERIRLLGQDLEQRQGALDKATEHLSQASALRRDAAETAHRLEDVARTIGSTLEKAEERAGDLQQVAGQLETRATALKSIDRQLDHFEELLGRWESAQSEAAKALEQTLARQAAVEALEAQVKHVFGLAERAVEDVQAIGSARREVEETKTLLEETQAKFKATEEALEGFDARKRQLERTEERLARAEALALGIRSTVESLVAQRAVVDHALESAGALALQMKQAEAVIATLRRERTLACELKAAVEAVGEEEV